MKKLKIFITLIFIVCSGINSVQTKDENLIDREDNDSVSIDFIIHHLNKVAGHGTFIKESEEIYINDYSKINDLNKDKLLEITESYKDKFNIKELKTQIINANING